MDTVLRHAELGGLVHDWNEAGPHRFHRSTGAVRLQDETLREGLQSPAAVDRSIETKIRLLHLMERLGVDSASLGIPVASRQARAAAERLCRTIVEGGMRLCPNLGGRTADTDVGAIVDVAERAGVAVEACLFVGSSPLRQYVEGWDLALLVRRTRDSVGLAVRAGLPVTFITEDTTRSRPEHLRELFAAALEAGATRVCLCDTVGCATPAGARNLVGWVREFLAATAPGTGVDWHGHQDRGLGLANALAAIEAGVDRVHATALGLGERVGNTSMEQLLVNLRLLGLRDGDLSAIPEYVAAAAELGAPVPRNAPVVGRDAFRTATGVHAAAVSKATAKGDFELADRVYSSVPASWVGRTQDIAIGPMSGAANVREVLRRADVAADAAVVTRVLERARRAGRVLERAEVLAEAEAAGAGEPLVGNYFVSNYPPFSCWDATGAETFVERLARADTSAPETPLGVYVHVPFCVQRCSYCYYLSHEGRTDRVDEYLDDVERETRLLAARPALSGRHADFVYVGGGTPSILHPAALARLCETLRSAFPWDRAREITVECAPASVNERKLRILHDAGVTRISLGVQQLDDDVLAASGRVHEVRDVMRAWQAIRGVGFEVVNLDLIVGLPEETDRSFDDGLERVIELGPESVTLYQLEIPLNTPLFRSVSAGDDGPTPAGWAVKRERLRRGFERLESAGYTVRSAYAAVRDPARHRFVYQDEQYRGADLLGIGVSSFSHVGGVNAQNLVSMAAYRQALAAGRLPSWRGYTLSPEEQAIRETVLQLKLGRVEKGAIRARHGVDVGTRFADVVAALAADGLVHDEPDAIVVTREGLLRIDRLLERFYAPRHRGLRYT